MAYTAIVLMLVIPPMCLVAELAYRVIHHVPISGGVVYEDDLRLDPDLLRQAPHVREFLARFQRSKHKVLFYEPRPNYSDELYKINSAGFRDRDFTEQKPNGVFRIIVLGDSIIWGHGVPQEKTFAKQMEAKLNNLAPGRFEVLNFGVSGYTTKQEVKFYEEKASRYDPDLVIVGYCLNDYTDYSAEGQAFHQLHYDLFSKSYLREHLERRLFSWSYENLGMNMTDSAIQEYLHAEFKELSRLTHPANNVVIIFPHFFQLDRYRFQNEHDRIAQALEGLDFELLDLVEAFRPYKAEDLILEPADRTHPNVIGTGIAVDATLAFINEKSLIPKVDLPTQAN